MTWQDLTYKNAAQRVRDTNVTADETPLSPGLLPALPPDAIPLDGWIFGDYTPIATGLDNGVHIVDVALIDGLPAAAGAVQYRQRRLASVTCTAGELMGTVGGLVLPDERVADTIVVAEQPFAVALGLKFGLRASDGEAELVIRYQDGIGGFLIGEFFRADYIRFALRGFSGGTTGANGLLQLHA